MPIGSTTTKPGCGSFGAIHPSPYVRGLPAGNRFSRPLRFRHLPGWYAPEASPTKIGRKTFGGLDERPGLDWPPRIRAGGPVVCGPSLAYCDQLMRSASATGRPIRHGGRFWDEGRRRHRLLARPILPPPSPRRRAIFPPRPSMGRALRRHLRGPSGLSVPTIPEWRAGPPTEGTPAAGPPAADLIRGGSKPRAHGRTSSRWTRPLPRGATPPCSWPRAGPTGRDSSIRGYAPIPRDHGGRRPERRWLTGLRDELCTARQAYLP